MHECNNCYKQITGPQMIYKYQDKIFCSDDCLKEYLFYHAEDEIETEWLDTKENIRSCALEEGAKI